MASFAHWLGLSNSPADESVHAVRAWNLIQRMNTESIVIRRGSSDLAAQTVRVEFRNGTPSMKGGANENAQGYEIDVVVFGVKNHPDVSDTNIKANDSFGLSGINYRVQDVVEHLGEVQAMCYRIGK